MIATLLITSGVVRSIDGGGFAMAQEINQQEQPISGEKTDDILGVPFSEYALNRLLSAFQIREQELLKNEESLELRKRALQEAEQQIGQQIIELTMIEEKLSSTLALADTAAQDDLDRLASVYENMKPRNAAEIFSEMPPGFAAGFLGLMQPETAAAVMSELDPNIAHTISVMLASRNANAFIE